MKKAADGDLYKVIEAYGKRFELYYGYYEEFERESGEPIPIYPDFKKEPCYTNDGQSFVTAMQDACEHYSGEYEKNCFGCRFYQPLEELLGICLCELNQKAT